MLEKEYEKDKICPRDESYYASYYALQTRKMSLSKLMCLLEPKCAFYQKGKSPSQTEYV